MDGSLSNWDEFDALALTNSFLIDSTMTLLQIASGAAMRTRSIPPVRHSRWLQSALAWTKLYGTVAMIMAVLTRFPRPAGASAANDRGSVPADAAEKASSNMTKVAQNIAREYRMATAKTRAIMCRVPPPPPPRATDIGAGAMGSSLCALAEKEPPYSPRTPKPTLRNFRARPAKKKARGVASLSHLLVPQVPVCVARIQAKQRRVTYL
mmetsp:Transcript_26624/g.48237  ORF Transcript_26624/g.48237 Transcript_26624/m.48237 type:complete len:209 (+) Transcript_26624:1365-1991(+)